MLRVWYQAASLDEAVHSNAAKIEIAPNSLECHISFQKIDFPTFPRRHKKNKAHQVHSSTECTEKYWREIPIGS